MQGGGKKRALGQGLVVRATPREYLVPGSALRLREVRRFQFGSFRLGSFGSFRFISVRFGEARLVRSVSFCFGSFGIVSFRIVSFPVFFVFAC